MNHVTTEPQLVSVVVITYNSGRYVAETLESIKAQSYEHIELIVADDHSRDNTVEICRAWLEQNRHRFVRTQIVAATQNGGIAANCNRGVHAAQGHWTKIIAGDDALEPHLVETYISFAQNHASVAAMVCRVQAYADSFTAGNELETESYESQRFNHQGCTAAEQFQILLRHNCVSAPTVMIHTATLKKLGGFNEAFPFLEDWPMWLELTRAGYKMHFVDTVGVKYRIHGYSVQQTSNKNVFLSRVESEVDRMYLYNYHQYLPFWERQAKLFLIRRNTFIARLSGNKNNWFVSFLSRTIGFIPRRFIKRAIRKTAFGI